MVAWACWRATRRLLVASRVGRKGVSEFIISLIFFNFIVQKSSTDDKQRKSRAEGCMARRTLECTYSGIP